MAEGVLDVEIVDAGDWAAVGLELAVDQFASMSVGRGATAGELRALDEDGFVLIPALLAEDQVASLCAEFERLVAEDPRSRTHELGTRRVLVANDNEALAVCWRHRVLLDAAAHLLGLAFEVSYVNLRDPEPRAGEQRLHPDHGPTPEPGITATWFLDAFTADNGATRLLRGSHRSPPHSPDVPIPGTERPGPGEVVPVGPAGSLLVRDVRLFHAAGHNATSSSRRSAFVFYQRHIDPHPDPDDVYR